jgi:hypothetical protein
MKRQVIAGAALLGLCAVALALGQPATPRPAPANAPAPAAQAPGRPKADQADLFARVARLRAEVEILQIEHDLTRDRFSAGWKERAEGVAGGASQKVARDYMRIGAELVGKGNEFEAAMQEKGDEVWKAVNKAVAATAPAEVDRLKQDLLRIATELNRKKIDLVALEIRLDESM